MIWQILLEVQLHGDPSNFETILDALMEHLVDSGIDDPMIGAEFSSGVVRVEFAVHASTLASARQTARDVVTKVLGEPGDGEFIGESTRRALVHA